MKKKDSPSHDDAEVYSKISYQGNKKSSSLSDMFCFIGCFSSSSGANWEKSSMFDLSSPPHTHLDIWKAILDCRLP